MEIEMEIDCDRELLPSILVQDLLNTILALSDDVGEIEPTTNADNRIIHHFRPVVVGDTEILDQLLIYYEWCNNDDPGHRRPPGLLLRMAMRIAPLPPPPPPS